MRGVRKREACDIGFACVDANMKEAANERLLLHALISL